MEDIKKETTPHFTSLNKRTGLLETRSSITGDLLAVQHSMDENILYTKEREAHLVKVDGKDVLVEAGIALNDIPKQSCVKVQWVYSTLVGEMVAQQIIDGKSMSKISEMEGYPPLHVISRWRKQNSSFDKMVRDAYKDRGEYHRDKVLDLADEDPIYYESDGKTPLTTKNGEVIMKPVDARKLQIETHKWLASTDNVERYGNKTKLEGDVNVKHMIFQIDTGIRRPNDPGYTIDSAKLVQDAENKKHEREITDGRISMAAGVLREKEATYIKASSQPSPSDGSDGLPFKPKE